jgi:hypothetical protein
MRGESGQARRLKRPSLQNRIQKKALVKSSEIELGVALEKLRTDWDWDSDIPEGYRFVVLRKGDGRRVRSDTIVSLRGALRSHSKAQTVKELLREIYPRLVIPHQKSFTINLTTASGEIVNGNKRINSLNSQAEKKNVKATIDETVESFLGNLAPNFYWETWHGESDYSFDDENELCFVITRAWIRGSLRKIGIRALRKALKEEGC